MDLCELASGAFCGLTGCTIASSGDMWAMAAAKVKLLWRWKHFLHNRGYAGYPLHFLGSMENSSASWSSQNNYRQDCPNCTREIQGSGGLSINFCLAVANTSRPSSFIDVQDEAPHTGGIISAVVFFSVVCCTNVASVLRYMRHIIWTWPAFNSSILKRLARFCKPHLVLQWGCFRFRVVDLFLTKYGNV